MITKFGNKYFLFLVIIVTGMCFYFFSGLPRGYSYLDYSSYVNRIELNDNTVIAPMVLDIDDANGFIVGLKLPIDYRKCFTDSSRESYHGDVEVLYLPEFFIIFSDSGRVLRFKNKSQFELALSEEGILEDIFLDYSAFDIFWERIPQTAKWDDFAGQDCPEPKEGEHEYSLSIMADIESGFRNIAELRKIKGKE
ncbi:hypothetical protein [Paraglaciecola sp. L3A3]|uniref:hypothetical protein n=1 Tax=Paraglaciecola sp. L3A3 TaxID=2686358 RepID=UPI00131A76D2|nr:hypothetical protein [Paraglaciecola sp. L3A3]